MVNPTTSLESAVIGRRRREVSNQPSRQTIETAETPETRSSDEKNKKKFGLPWNVIDNKGPEMRKMGQVRLPWNVYENQGLNPDYPGMFLINKVVSPFSDLPLLRS
jgi:hypothetical protein